MSDSDSDSDSSLLAAYYSFHGKKKKEEAEASVTVERPKIGRSSTANDSSSSISSSSDGGKENVTKRKASASVLRGVAASKIAIAPKVTYTGSREEPMCLDSSSDDDDSDDDSSILEILAPLKEKQQFRKKAPPTSKPAALKKPPPVAALPANNNNNNNKKRFSLGDSSDSDSSLLNAAPMFAPSRRPAPAAKLNTSNIDTTYSTSAVARLPVDKEMEKERKKRDQEGRKQEKLAQKQAEQARKKAEREALRDQKLAQKQADTEARKRKRIEQQQFRGNFATQEIVLLVDPPLFRRPQEQTDCYDWKEHEEIEKHGLTVQEYHSVLGGRNCHALQWIRREHLKGGANEAWQQLRGGNAEGYTHLDRLVIVMDDPKVFIDLLRRSPQDHNDDDYPELRRWLFGVEHGWRAAWPQSSTKEKNGKSTVKRPKIIILLRQGMKELDRQWVQHRRANKNNQRRDAVVAPPSSEEFHDALAWLIIQYQVECMLCDSYEEIWTTVLKMTRAMAKAPYEKPVSELECIKKLKPQIPANADGSAPSVLDIAKDCWVRQLQQIPGISETMARNLARHYPTMQDLWRAYQVADNPEELVAGCLNEKTYQQKKAESIYKLFTTLDPDELI